MNLTRFIFDYISQNLIGKDLLFARTDIFLGFGFECAGLAVLSGVKLMYALTRLNSEIDKCLDEDFPRPNKCFKLHYNIIHWPDSLQSNITSEGSHLC